jgi:cytochrome c peroxidase
VTGVQTYALPIYNQGQCTRCHNGPLFTNNHFHNIGIEPVARREDGRGRLVGIRSADADEFNCLGMYSGAPEPACAELRFAKRNGAELLGGFKTPTLRNLSKTAPYMHAGQLETLDKVLWHYRETPRALIGQTELRTLTLTNSQFEQLELFLLTLDSPVRAPARFLRPPGEE